MRILGLVGIQSQSKLSSFGASDAEQLLMWLTSLSRSQPAQQLLGDDAKFVVAGHFDRVIVFGPGCRRRRFRPLLVLIPYMLCMNGTSMPVSQMCRTMTS